MASIKGVLQKLAQMDLVSRLCDLSFEKFITLKITRFLYVFGILIAAVSNVIAVRAGFIQSTALGIWFLILSPVLFLVNLIIIRFLLEVVVVIFRIEANLRQLTRDKATRNSITERETGT